jgi:photosystem II stability/assembly factor-like uncharacterized protein
MCPIAWHASAAVVAAALALACTERVSAQAASAAFEPEARIVRVDRVRMIALARVGTRLVAAGERGRVLTSEDDGKTWVVAATPAMTTLTSLTFVDEKTGFATGHQATLLRTEDGGRTWTAATVEIGEKATLFALRIHGSKGMAVGGYGAFIETADGGRTWKERRIGPKGFDRHLTGIAAIGADRIVIAGEAGTLLRSTDGGANWELLKPPYEGSYFGISAVNDGTLIAYGMRGNALRSDDGGNTWQRISLGDYKGALQTGAELADGTVVLAGADGMIALSADHGKTFTAKRIGDRRTVAALQRTSAGAWLTAGPSGLRPAE